MKVHLHSNARLRYLQVHQGGGSGAGATPPGAQAMALTWETFEFGDGTGAPIAEPLSQNRRVTLRTQRGNLLTVGNGGVVQATATGSPGIAEQFDIRLLRVSGQRPNDGSIRAGDIVGFTTHGSILAGTPPSLSRRWLTMESDGRVVADRTARGPWEEFRFWPTPLPSLKLRWDREPKAPFTGRYTLSAIASLDCPAPPGGTRMAFRRTVDPADREQYVSAWPSSASVFVQEGGRSASLVLNVEAGYYSPGSSCLQVEAWNLATEAFRDTPVEPQVVLQKTFIRR
jgi:hypothetical protein